MLLADELQTPLEGVMLAKLGAADLGRLACTCAQLHTSLAAVNPDIWRKAAAAMLYDIHPKLSSASIASVKQALQSYQESRRNIHQNKHSTILQLPKARNICISPSGSRVALIAKVQNGQGCEGAYLQVFHADTTASRLQLAFQIQLAAIHASRSLHMQLVWSADEQTLTFLCTDAATLDCTMYDAASGQQLSALQLLHDGRTPYQISPNGQLFAYRSEEQLAIYDLSSQTIHTWGHMVGLRAMWSPDSLKIAYNHVLQEVEDDISAVTNCIHRLDNGPQTGYGVLKIWEPDTWSNDGRYLACAVFGKYMRREGNRIFYTHPTSTFKVFDVWSNSTALELSDVHHATGLTFSHDSRSVVAARSVPGSSRNWEIWDLASASMTCSFSREHSFKHVSWSPDGSYISVVNDFCVKDLLEAFDSSSHLHIHDAATGSRVSDITMGRAVGKIEKAVWHPAQSSIFLEHAGGITAVGFAPSSQAGAGHPPL